MTTDAATIEFGLTLRPATTTAPAAAWFIAGGDPAAWLDEVCRWGVPLAGVRLYPVPQSARTRTPCGVLATCDGTPAVRAALPYAAVGGRLFHPADAIVTPAVSSAELAAALRHAVVVLHPSAGPVGFGAGDVVQVHDLLAPPPARAADWSHASAGPTPLPRLVSVDAEPLPPTLSAMLDQGREDIGSAADEPVPDGAEPAKPASVFGRIKSALTGGPPAESLQAKRQRELDRLLELLKTDPDAGLQHALPLRDVATRGVAPPSGSLGRRDVSFDLSGLSGGNRPGDAWSMANDTRQRLTAQYREAANRELHLGRHRRAAYIFAHLLGDYAAAADALKQGRHYREAAALYREQLKNPRAAADCLLAGGLVGEAIPLYWDLLEFERAGDLYLRLGEPATAADCYRHAVAQARERHDPVRAARLLEAKLASPDEGLAVLSEAWPDSDKAATCLAEWFALAGRTGRHELAVARTAGLRDAAVPTIQGVPLVETLAAVAGTYPNADVRHRAADATRVLVGRRLPAAHATDRRALVRAVVDLAPADKLLARDGTRYLDPPNVRPKPTIPLKGEPTVVRSFRLDAGFQWRAVVSVPDGFLALGSRDGYLMLARGRWDGRVQTASQSRNTRHEKGYVLLPPTPDGRVVVAAVGGVPRRVDTAIVLAQSDGFGQRLRGETPTTVAPGTIAACQSDDGTVWTWARDGTLQAAASDGRLLATHALPVDGEDWPAPPVPMAARRGIVYRLSARALVRGTGGSRQYRLDLSANARDLVPSPPQTAMRMLITFDEGAALVRGDDVRRFGQPLVRPAATFTPDGSVVAVGEGLGHVYRSTGDGGLSFVDRFDVAVRTPLAVLPAGAGQVAAFDADGGVYVCRFAVR